LTGLSPVALCRNVNKLRYFYRENYSSLLNFKNVFQHRWIFVLTQSKMLLAARSALNLYECAVSASNSDIYSMNF
jgi:hypothetical protein